VVRVAITIAFRSGDRTPVGGALLAGVVITAALMLSPARAAATVGLTQIPVVPAQATAAVFSPFPGLPGTPSSFDRSVARVEKYLDTEHYSVKEYVGTQATYTNFVRMARAKVVVFFTHGGDGGDILVQFAPTKAAMDSAYARYVGKGCAPCYSRAWIKHESFEDGTGKHPHTLYAIEITPQGITHFFADAKVALVGAFSCTSLNSARYFRALSYFGYGACVRIINALSDSINVFGRLTGDAGLTARTTSGAIEDMRPRDSFSLVGPDGKSAPEPVVLSPAVDPAPADGTAGRLSAGAQYEQAVRFDAAMDTRDPGKVVHASGCGASISNAEWSGSGTVLNFNVNVPSGTSPGVITLTVGAHDAVAAPGGEPNQWLDGNQDPAGQSGVAPNGDDYTWQVPCTPDTYPVKIVYTGTFTDSYHSPCNNIPGGCNSNGQKTYTWTETQFSQARFRGSAAQIIPGSGTVSVSGGVSDSPGGSCSAAPSSSTPQAGIEFGQQSVVGSTTTRTLGVYASIPQVAMSGDPVCQSDNGGQPDSLSQAVYTPTDGPAAYTNASLGMVTVDLAKLELGPVVTSFPVDYTAVAQDGTGAVDHLVVSATETISLANS
jgi:hypothetical protein